MYRMGPVRRDESIPHGLEPVAKCGNIQLLRNVKTY